MPTNEVLFHHDPTTDLTLTDPCKKLEETDITATPIEINGVKYFYIRDNNGFYTFYIYDENLGGHIPVDPSETDYLVKAMGAGTR